MSDILTTLVPFINAAGIPILAFAIIILLRVYQKIGESYQQSANYLREENERLRRRMEQADSHYFDYLDKVRTLATKASELENQLITGQLKARISKVDLSEEDVMKVDAAIRTVQRLTELTAEVDNKVREQVSSIDRQTQTLIAHLKVFTEELKTADPKTLVVVSENINLQAADEIRALEVSTIADQYARANSSLPFTNMMDEIIESEEETVHEELPAQLDDGADSN
jgi:hypothetical protein